MLIEDSDETRQPSSSTPDDGQDLRVHGDLLVERAVHEQVVDAHRPRALEGIAGRLHVVLLLQAQEVVGKRGHQLGLDDAFGDRVAVPRDPVEMVLARVHVLLYREAPAQVYEAFRPTITSSRVDARGARKR